jgi:uncharacterized membrane protein
MTPGLGFALGAMLGFAVSDIVYKRGAAAGLPAGEFVVLQAWAFCPAVTLYALLTGTLDLHTAALWGSLAGLFLLVAMYNFARSLQDGAVSTNASIFRLNFTLTAALAILFLGETLTLAKSIALVCALAAVWLLLGDGGNKTSGRLKIASLGRVLVATVALALTNFFYKVGLRHGVLPETMVVAQAWMFCPLATVLFWLRERRFTFSERKSAAWRYPVIAAIAQSFAFIFLMHGLATGPASVLVPIGQMSFVLTALFGVAALGEGLTTRKCLGLAVAIAALALFAVSA